MSEIQPFVFDVKNYRKNMTIGCADDEQQMVQEVVFDVRVHVSPKAHHLVDTWDPDFDYCLITEEIDQACAAHGVKILQEPLAFEAVCRIFARHADIVRVELHIKKTQRYTGTDWIGFSLDLTRFQVLELMSQIDSLKLLSLAPNVETA